jgi:putative oxidoreductase
MNRHAPLAQYQSQLLGILRIVAGLLFFAHGIDKLTGFPPGAQPGQEPLLSLMGAACVIELVTGACIILGVFTRSSAFLASGEMAIAYWTVHIKASFFPNVNGGESAIFFCFVFLYLAAAGPGAFSIEPLFKKDRHAESG